jgi:hypothetical protein
MEEVTEVEVLEAELVLLIRKMFVRNFYVEERVSSILRGLRYEEANNIPPLEDRH